MTNKISNIFSFHDRMQMETLNQRLRRSHVLHANIANAETPGFRALGYDFEEQLQALAEVGEPLNLKVTNPLHKTSAFSQADASIQPDVYVRPTESVSHDGNTVDMDAELNHLSHNQILYRTATETITRKIGLLKYAINGGR